MAIEVTWMQNRAPDMDALTELSRMSLGPSLPSSSTIPDQVRLSTGPPAEIHVPPSGIRHVSGSCFGRASHHDVLPRNKLHTQAYSPLIKSQRCGKTFVSCG